MIRSASIFSRNTTNAMSSLHHTKKHIMEHCLIIGDINFDYFVKVMSTTSLHCTVTVFHFAVNLQTVTWRLISCSSSNTQPLVLSSTDDSLLNQVLQRWLQNSDFHPPKLYHCFHIY